jgi:tetratricopeptide (TPR) repeat protein
MYVMSEEKTYTAAEAHRHFAIQFNGETWGLLNRTERSKEDNDRMVLAAYASLRHWLEAGTGVHQQRGEWLIARVYSVLGVAESALYHATRCLELTERRATEMEDFDRAYAYEAMARANAVAGNRDEALKYIELAEKAGEAIADAQNKEIFDGDFNGGQWYGLR